MNNITVAYPLGGYIDRFISRKVYEADFVGFLTEYTTVLKLPIEYLEEGYEFEPDPDYLLLNIDTWGLKMFMLREQGKIDMPFIIHFHVIYSQHIYISYLLPLLRKEDIVVVGSEYSRKCLLNISGVLDVPVIPLALDIEAIAKCSDTDSSPPVIQKSPDKKNIGYLGQLIPGKGIKELIESMPDIVKNVEKDVSLNVIGPLSGSELDGKKSGYVTELVQCAEDLGVSNHVNFTGVLLGEEKYRALSQCDIFVNPSTFLIETFGVVNTEALACALPVVCTRWSAFNEVITDGKDGFLIDVREAADGTYQLNREQLIDHTVTLLNDTVLLEKMKIEAGKSARRYDYRRLTPMLTGLLKKKKNSIKGNWESLKDKSFIDFRHLFRDRWLEVIQTDMLDYKTYGEMEHTGNSGVKFSLSQRLEAFKYLSGR